MQSKFYFILQAVFIASSFTCRTCYVDLLLSPVFYRAYLICLAVKQCETNILLYSKTFECYILMKTMLTDMFKSCLIQFSVVVT